MVRTPGGRLKILDIERSLGVWWPLGFSRHKDRLKIPIVKRLEDGVKKITPVFGAKNQTEIRASDELRVEAERLFADVGPELWPDAEHDRSEWLVDATQNDLAGQYPNNLYYANDADRAKLWDLFYLLIIAKTIRYYENHGRGWHYETAETQSNERPEHEGVNGLLDQISDDAADDSDYDTRSPSNDPAQRPSSQRHPQPRHSPSGFTPVNPTPVQYSTSGDDPGIRPYEQFGATSIGGFRTAFPAEPSSATNKRSEPEDAELPESKKIKQQYTVRDATPSTEPKALPSRPLSSDDVGAATSAQLNPADGGVETPPALEPPRPYAAHSPAAPAQDAYFKHEPHSYAKDTTPALADRPDDATDVRSNGPDTAKLLNLNELRLEVAGSGNTSSVHEALQQSELIPSQSSQPLAVSSGRSLTGKGGRSHRAKYRPIAHAVPGAIEPNITTGGAGKTKAAIVRQQQPPPHMSNGAIPKEMVAPQYFPAMASYSSPYDPAGTTPALDVPSANAYYGPPGPGPTQAPMLPAGQLMNGFVLRSNNDEVFAVTEVEIDWWAENEVQGFMQLDPNDNVETFFAKLDDEMPPSLKGRAVRAVRIEHLNHESQAGKPFNARIRRGGFAGFKALIRRLQQQRVGAVPELVVTVEWET